MGMETRPTIGQISTELIQKQPDNIVTPIEQMRESLSDYDKNLWEAADRGKKELLTQGDFFLVVITKKERLMTNVLRNYFYPRITCPTPDYDQAVYIYHRDVDEIEFAWVIPSRDVCHHLMFNSLTIPDEQKALLNFVLDFADGNLYRRCKELNGEKPDSNELEQ